MTDSKVSDAEAGEPSDYARVVQICEAHGIGLPVDCIEMVVEIIRLAAPQPASEQQGGTDDFIGVLTVKRFRGANSMVNTDFEYLGNLPDGSYRCYLRPVVEQQAARAIIACTKGSGHA